MGMEASIRLLLMVDGDCWPLQ